MLPLLLTAVSEGRLTLEVHIMLLYILPLFYLQFCTSIVLSYMFINQHLLFSHLVIN